jgi:integrase
VYPSGRRAFYVVYRARGRAEWLHLGDIPIADARKRRDRVAVMVADGKDPAAEKRAAHGGTFGELAERYAREHSSRHNKSWVQADRLTRRYLLPRWGRLQPAAITRGDVRAMMASIAAPILANQVLASCSGIFSWAVSMDIVPTNPCTGIKRNPTASRARILSDDEIPKFWAALDSVGLLRSAMLRTIWLTGQRGGEVRHMLRQHIIGDWWEMPGRPDPACDWPGLKNHTDHSVYLSQPVRRIIAELSSGETTGFVFASDRGRPIGGLDAAVRKICADTGIPDLRPHDLRRTFGSTVTGLGLGRATMDRLLNHADHSIASVYDRHAYRREDQAAWERVAAHVVAIAEGQVIDNVVEFAASNN